jgi:UDP-glucose 4-epimerase
MAWLVTGGAGYIGAHIVRAFRRSGREVVVLDDLSTGIERKVPNGVPLIEASVLDTVAVTGAIERYDIDGVVHLAAKKAVEESVRQPLHYYEENVEGFRRLLDVMVRTDVQRLVLSSSAAVYGMPDVDLVTEDQPCAPVNPYGQTKLVCEWMATAAGEAHALRPVLLRYFNVAGSAANELGDPGVTNLIPLVLRALATGEAPVIFGEDYPTPDGTCVRDFIHVEDLAEAHVVAALALEHDPTGTSIYNVSRGVGYSVR